MRARIKCLLPILAAVLALGGPAAAQDFDYYLLVLSWSPSWCAATGAARGAPECAPARDLGFTLHGLWPQDEDGWPEYCATAAADPSRRQTGAMADVMGSGGLAWYQWKKHGRCSGLSAPAYFAAARRAFGALALPELGRRVTAEAVEAAMLGANPGLDADALVVTCRGGRLAEIRLCLSRDLAPRACGRDVADDACRSRDPLEIPRR